MDSLVIMARVSLLSGPAVAGESRGYGKQVVSLCGSRCRSGEQPEEAVGLAFQGAGRVAGAGRAARPEHDQPEQGCQAPEVLHPGLLGPGQVEQGQKVICVQPGV